MATLRKRKLPSGKHVYLIDFYHEGRRHRKSTGTDDKKLAEKILKKIEGEQVSGRFGLEIPRKPVLLADYAAEYVTHAEANKSKSTSDNERYLLRLFIEFIGNKPILSITSQDIENYKVLRMKAGQTSQTIHSVLRWLNTIFQYAIMKGYIVVNPVKGVVRPRVDDKIPSFLSIPEIRRFMEGIRNPEHTAAFGILLYTGLRRGEMLKLTWDNVNLTTKRITVVAGKTGKARTIPINVKLLKILKEYKRVHPESMLFKVSKFMIHNYFNQYKEKAGIKSGVTTHSLRHTFASHLVMEGVSLYVVKELLGHSSIKMTEIYAHLSPDLHQGAVNKIPY